MDNQVMFEVIHPELPSEFVSAWRSAGRHLHHIGQGGIGWIRATLNPPIMEHLSFRLGNQLFFIYIDTDVLPFEGRRKNTFLDVAREATATACVLKMERRGAAFVPRHGDWGLLDAATGLVVNPAGLVSDEHIEMSDWELHDFAIQLVRSHLKKEGKHVFSAQSSLNVDPAIWFEDEKGRSWVVVRAVRYPMKTAERPANLEVIKQFCSRMSPVGFFASVSAANADDPFDPSGEGAIDPFDPSGEGAMPLYRGHAIRPRFIGLEPV